MIASSVPLSVPLIHQRDENSNAGRPKIQENEKCSTKGNSTFAWPHGHHASRAPPPPGVWLPDATVRAARGRRLGSAAGLVPRVLHPKKRAFLAAFSRCGSISQSAKRANVDRRTPYNWLREDAAYRQAYQQATIEAGDRLEDRMTELAFDGNVTA